MVGNASLQFAIQSQHRETQKFMIIGENKFREMTLTAQRIQITER